MLTNFKNSSVNSWINSTVNNWKTAITVGEVTALYTEPYGDGEDSSIQVIHLYEESYGDMLVITALYTESYGIRLGKMFVEQYGDVSKIIKRFDEYYGSALLSTRRILLPYGDAYFQTSWFSLPWDLVGSLVRAFEEPYGISQTGLVRVFEEPYNLLQYNSVLHVFEEPYYLMLGDSSIVSSSASVVINGVSIDFSSIEINAGMDNYCISCEMLVCSMDMYIQCSYLAEAIVTIDGQVFNFFVESKSRTVQNDKITFSVGMLSPTAKLDSPYSETIIDNLESGISAHTLIQNMADIQNITVDNQILDWSIPGYAISINDETPLTVIKKVANAVGGIVQSKPNGDLLIISTYPVSPVNWETEIPTEILTTEFNILSLTETFDIRSGYNAFSVSDQGSSSESITLEEVTIDTTTKIIKGYRVPFDDGEFDLETSGGYEVSISKYPYPIIKSMPIIEQEEDSEWELVEFIDYVGSVSHPIYSIIAWDWIQDDLGAFQISEEGSLTIINQTSVPGESLLRIKYTTKYWQWTIKGPVNIPIQMYVPEIENT